LPSIDRRVAELQEKHLSTAYAKQKQSLKDELEDFLHALPGKKTMFTATPIDVCRFPFIRIIVVNPSFIPKFVLM
jgi:hypothetical protein